MEGEEIIRKDDNMEIKYVSVENSVAEWADKKSILKRTETMGRFESLHS